MVDSAWADSKLAAAHLLAAVNDLKALGCYALEYPKANPSFHINGSRHAATGYGGRACACDVNRDPRGPNSEDERAWFEKVGQHIAWGHGLSVTCGIYGYVENHSGANMHLHIDDGPWSNVGDKRGVFRTPKAARPTLPAWPVRAFQKAHGLVVDGIPGKLTISALQKLVGAKVDGIAGRETWSKVQAKVGAVVDGIPGGETYFKLGVAIEGGEL
ncbi:peptidoglycan-binding protein [Dermacoccus nishinomiyaensis]|uniref:peptidoglycan-binding domain-containing protein n=1 Tax=Dermacoccus nishinomiyaensis TaxID=1274 RepID=UPI000DFD03A5|nr:peptidoglycan-binding protein [Dermacoccus nishinomiyaensis]QQY23900.1 peptidoglycan-binding protein [Dermacoccus nishinomiyaensis]STD12240.1 spore cortex-lytic enzyme [Dermacoccus nishinomiyaensis]STD70939.1 spore cortex-lytic enzyme [Dermacoccus nishinomiyaensis]